MKQFRIKTNVDPKVLYNFGFVYRGNWARGKLYQKEIPELKGKGNGISINFDLGAEISFITPYMDIEYPNIENYIQDLIKAGYVEEFEQCEAKEDIEKEVEVDE